MLLSALLCSCVVYLISCLHLHVHVCSQVMVVEGHIPMKLGKIMAAVVAEGVTQVVAAAV